MERGGGLSQNTMTESGTLPWNNAIFGVLGNVGLEFCRRLQDFQTRHGETVNSSAMKPSPQMKINQQFPPDAGL